ncbi:MAG: hypothetical protein AB1762_09085 [Gemmatimonadota bacterium]
MNSVWLMQLLPRASALGLLFALGQYILVGSGFGCREPSHAEAGLPASGSAALVAHVAPAHDTDCGGAPGDMSCPLDSVVCSSMAVCGSVVMTAALRQTASTDGGMQVVPRFGTVHAATRTVAPEPPPPRA